jgi:hypothetical protein
MLIKIISLFYTLLLKYEVNEIDFMEGFFRKDKQ